MKVCDAYGVESVAVNVPSVVGVPLLKVSVTVTVLFTVVVGVVNANLALPDVEPSGVKKVPLSHVAVAVLVPLLGLGTAV